MWPEPLAVHEWLFDLCKQGSVLEAEAATVLERMISDPSIRAFYKPLFEETGTSYLVFRRFFREIQSMLCMFNSFAILPLM